MTHCAALTFVPQGQFVAVMGPSGSGKSTLLHLMSGLDTPSDGDVMLGGKRLAHLSDDEITIILQPRLPDECRDYVSVSLSARAKCAR